MHFVKIKSVGLLNLSLVAYVQEDYVRLSCHSTAAITPEEHAKIEAYINHTMGGIWNG